MPEPTDNPVGPSETRVFHELSYTVVATPYQHRVEYRVYEVMGFTSDNKPVYGPKFLEDKHAAELFLRGSVKWDGCSNWWFEDMSRHHFIHACSKDDLLDIGKVMAECYDWTATLCPNWMD